MLQRAETSPKTVILPGFRILDLQTCPKYKGFCIDSRSSRRHSMSLHVEGPFVKNFTFFIFVFFPETKMIVGDAKKRIPGTVKSMMPKVTRLEIFFHRLGSFFRSPHHIVLSFFNMYKVVTIFYKSMNKINGVSAFLQKRYIFKIISSKKYSTVFNDFWFLVKQRSSVLTSTWNHSIRLIHRWGIES